MEIERTWFINRISELSNSSPTSYGTDSWNRKMRSLFGVTIRTITHIWKVIKLRGPETIDMEHLLMAFYFLKVYPTESVGSGVFRVTEKTWRSRVKTILERISHMDVVCRFISTQNTLKFFVYCCSIFID
jgi:hypothetical protein